MAAKLGSNYHQFSWPKTRFEGRGMMEVSEEEKLGMVDLIIFIKKQNFIKENLSKRVD